MTSNSSKALPFASLAIGFALAVMSALGYDVVSILDRIWPILAITSGGGLVAKLIEGSVQKAKEFKAGATVKSVVDEVKKEASQ